MIAPEVVIEIRSLFMAEALALMWSACHPECCDCERCRFRLLANQLYDGAVIQ